MAKQKLDYVPENGMVTLKRGNWTAPDGSVWTVRGGHWSLIADAPGAMDRRGARLYFWLGFFVSLAVFAKPVGMAFTYLPAAVVVLVGISFIVGALMVRAGTSAED